MALINRASDLAEIREQAPERDLAGDAKGLSGAAKNGPSHALTGSAGWVFLGREKGSKIYQMV